MERIHESIKSVPSIAPVELSAAAATDGALGGTNGFIDTQGFDDVAVKTFFGVVHASQTDVDITIYESDDTTGPGTAIPSAEVLNLTGSTADNTIRTIAFRAGGRAAGKRKRYIRPKITLGAAQSTLVACWVDLGLAHEHPVTQPTAAVVAS